MSEFVDVTEHGRVLEVRIDSGKGNPISFEVIAALNEVLDTFEKSESHGSLVISGQPGIFSGGFDLAVMRGENVDDVIRLVGLGGKLIHRIFSGHKPSVAAVTGHAVAAGALLALGTDSRIGADDARMGLPEVALGMVLPDWAAILAEARLNPSHLQRATATAAMFEGTDNVAAGFLDEIVPAERVVERALVEGERLADLSPRAYIGTMERHRRPISDAMAKAVEVEMAATGS